VKYLLLSLVLLASCAKKPFVSDKIKNSPPKYVLVLPPENQTSNTNVEEVVYPIAYQFLSQRGYLAISPELARMIFNANKLEDAGRINQLPTQKFLEIFGVDAVLKTKVTEWSSSYVVLSSSVTVGLDMEIVDTKSGESLWKFDQVLSKAPSNSGGGLIGGLINAALHAATQDYAPIAAENTFNMMRTVPEGPYKGKW
jgi:hypothetical protein